MRRPNLCACTFFIGLLVGWCSLVNAQTSTSSRPQTPEGWAERLQRFGKAIPQEKVYVQMDNTCYFLGDTIWYAAYTRRTDKDVPSNVSRVLYVELFNQDGYLVERQLVEMKQGRGHGNFVLTDTLYGGYYELRAYTRWQLNWGMTQHPHTKYAEKWFFNKAMAREYYRDYDKLYSRVFPVYDKPKQAGEFFHDMTTRPLRRNYKEDDEGKEILLSFYPEGGRIVGGDWCHVAFEATDDRGMWMEGKMELFLRNEKTKLKNMSGQEVESVETVNRGRGQLAFLPEVGAKYEARFTAKDGRTAKATLERVPADGVALHVERHSDEFVINVRPHGIAATKPLGITIMHEGVVEHFEEIATSQIHFKSSSPGVHQATVFDADGRVWADRLFFATAAALAQPSLTISQPQTQYNPFEEVTLDVQGPSASAALSISVRDASTQDYTYDNGNILTEMLLASEIKGFVPQPGYFFEKDDEEHRMALDLLMLTQGWRRFDWKTMATPGAFALLHPAETQTPVLSGIVHQYIAQQKENELREQDLADHQRFMEEQPEDAFAEDGEETEPGGFDNSETFQQMVEDSKKDILRPGQYKASGDLASSRYFEDEGRLKREVRVHAEFTRDDSEGIVGDVNTQKGRFRLQIPHFQGYCFFFLAASDTTKWKNGQEPLWVNMDEEEYPEYYVRLSFPYPRFVKPYTFYHTQQAPTPQGVELDLDFMTDNATTMQAVTVQGKRRRGLRRFDASKPAFAIDAYQAFNEAADAGICVAWYQGYNHFINDIARTYIGDMNIERAYSIERRFNTRNSSFYHSTAAMDAYNKLYNLDKVYVYTDYSPRREGLHAFEQDNQPSVTIDLRRYPDESMRTTYRDRRYVLQGFNVADDYYHPNYKLNPPTDGQNDYRRTLYWNPELQLDAEGKATVRFFTGSKPTALTIEANGQAADGILLTN
ncbi:MAG: hypothetical protein J6W75_08725 [Bacteroidaceae bacterium]|nr:hypothetical protein [Bacteroidaceae bacterium]